LTDTYNTNVKPRDFVHDMGDNNDRIKYTIIKIIVEHIKYGRVDFMIDGRILSISIFVETFVVDGVGRCSLIIR
jgi:hypothetical protein